MYQLGNEDGVPGSESLEQAILTQAIADGAVEMVRNLALGDVLGNVVTGLVGCYIINPGGIASGDGFPGGM